MSNKLLLFKLDQIGENQDYRVTVERGEDDGSNLTPFSPISLPYNAQLFQYSDELEKQYKLVLKSWENSPNVPQINPNLKTIITRITRSFSINKTSLGQPIEVIIHKCNEIAEQLSKCLNEWLDHESLRHILDLLKTELNRDDIIRVIIRSNDHKFYKIHLGYWRFLQHYPNAQYSIGKLEFQEQKSTLDEVQELRILGILGSSIGINIKKDEKLITELFTDTKVEFLPQPERKEITDKLWDDQYHLLFFAGHSYTENNQGIIMINNHDSLTIDELKYSLTNAVKQGLIIAIFNSCDSLGIAQQLHDLNIPYIIVMRYPIPDEVAQEFLKYLLKNLRKYDLYLAVKKAAERLECFQNKFPQVTTLPIIWSTGNKPLGNLFSTRTGGRISGNKWPENNVPPIIEAIPIKLNFKKDLGKILLFSLISSVVVMTVRSLGILQDVEILSYGFLMSKRPSEPINPHIVAIKITDEDIQYINKDNEYRMNDYLIAKMIQKIEKYEPKVIGVGMINVDNSGTKQSEGSPELINTINNNDNIFAVCTFNSNTITNKVPYQNRFYQVVKDQDKDLHRIGFNDLFYKELFPNKIGKLAIGALISKNNHLSPHSDCQAEYNINILLINKYILTENNSNQRNSLNKLINSSLPNRYGGLQNTGQSNTILINFININNTKNTKPAKSFTLMDVLEGKIKKEDIKDKIILISDTSSNSNKKFDTPLDKMDGIWINVNIISQIIDTWEHKRPLIWVLPQWGDIQWGDFIFVSIWSLNIGLLTWRFRPLSRRVLIYCIEIVALGGVCLVVLIYGGWLPLVPSCLSMILNVIIISSKFEPPKSR